MERAVAGVRISIRHSGTDRSVLTTAGPLQGWTVALKSQDFDFEETIALAGESTAVDSEVFATLVDVCLVREFPGSQDMDPFATASLREWRAQNRDELVELVEGLRAE